MMDNNESGGDSPRVVVEMSNSWQIVGKISLVC